MSAVRRPMPAARPAEMGYDVCAALHGPADRFRAAPACMTNGHAECQGRFEKPASLIRAIYCLLLTPADSLPARASGSPLDR